MAAKTRTISTLIESQLPSFIANDYTQFSKFVEKYYEQQEIQGQPLDIISNITKYRDINFYEKTILEQYTNLSSSINSNATTIGVESTKSFPDKNGYIRIGNEICFYKEKTDTEFLEVSRGVSGNITIGDLYNNSEFVTTTAESHYQNDTVYNVSNLFLYALVKSFENEYLGAFPEKYLKKEVDKRTLIKNIGKFYKAKGTERSIKFIFNSIISTDVTENVSVYNPRDFTIKGSTSDWTTVYSIKVKVLSGDIFKLIGNQITQKLDDYDKTISFASAIVDNVAYVGKSDGDNIYELIVQPASVNGEFKVFSKTTLKSNISVNDNLNDRITVYSTAGYPKQGKILIGTETILYKEKNVNQFVILERSNPQNHNTGKIVYNFSTVQGLYDNGVVNLLPVGLVYNILPSNPNPFSESGDFVQISDPGFETRDPIIFDSINDQIRWIMNDEASKASSTYSSINNQINDLVSDVSAIYQDDQYYYICSSSFPSYTSVLNNNVTTPLQDQKLLKLIRKRPITTTEVYSTSDRDVGIFIDGTPAFSYKDEEYVDYGKIVKVNIDSKGSGYKAAPTVLINNIPKKARSVLSGETIDSIIIDTEELFDTKPVITITSGRGARLSPVVTNGRITSINVKDPGEYYTFPPRIIITDDNGKGNFAEYEAILSPEGTIESCKRISGGRFYERETVRVTVESIGYGAQATPVIRRWVKNRYNKLRTKLDINNAFGFINFNPTKNYGYGVVANPKLLRYKVGDSINASYEQTNVVTHSPILGYAYDGNPIYGPYGYSDPVDSTSSVVRLSSGYSIKGSRSDGPTTTEYVLGTFVDDYEWVPSVNSGKTELDPNNGRFCVTPEYPSGVYAYFITIDNNNAPVFPYILGQNYYSLPVDSNYNSNISQDDLPVNVKRLKSNYYEKNGEDVYCTIQDTKSGNVSSSIVEYTPPNFSVNNSLIVDNDLTEGYGASAVVSSVKGKDVVSIESKDTKAVKIAVKENSYLFAGDIISQIDSEGEVVAAGRLIGDVFTDRTFVLRDCELTFNTTDKLFSQTKVINLILDKNASFTKGAIVTLTDGKGEEDSNIATGEVLEGTNKQNSLKLKVIPIAEYPDDFIINPDYFLKSSNLGDTARAEIISITSLSENLEIFELEDNIAIVETDSPHNLAIDDKVIIDITPDDTNTETTYYVRKRLYQSAILNDIQHSSVINDSGIGEITYLNTGLDYTAGTFVNVELIFRDSSLVRSNIGLPGDAYNAKATVVINNINGSGFGTVQSITFTDKGRNYRKGDILTIADDDLQRALSSDNNQRILIEVDHVGLGRSNTTLSLSNVTNLSVDDYLTIGDEIVKITDVDVNNKKLQILRGQKGTSAINHYDKKQISLYEGNYRFNTGYRPFGDGVNKPFYISYDENKKEIFVSYDYGVNTPLKLLLSSSFYDSSSPAKLVTLKTTTDPEYQLEFSNTNITFKTNPIIDIQKYYKYTFDTSHYSMLGTFLDFSASSNYNIFTEEKYTNNIPPGNAGSFLSIKFGFGPNISSNNYVNKQPLNYSNYFYFIKATNNVNTKNSYLRIINDPLIGEKKVIYTTDTRFVYSLNDVPAYDGSGDITYTTTSEYAVGEIDTVKIVDTGSDYKRIPCVVGVTPTISKEAQVEVSYDSIKKRITAVKVTNQGSNYSKPKLILVDSDGVGAKFDIVSLNGKIKNVKVVDGGQGYTYQPTAKIVESDVKIYFTSDNIGLPQNVKIVNNGKAFHSDYTTLPSFKSNTIFVLKNIDNKEFKQGEKIYQAYSGATARVSKNGWKPCSNLLKVEKIDGIFVDNYPIQGLSSKNTATISKQISTEFTPQITSYYNNLGYYNSDRGKLSTNSQKLTDSYFYQDYSYVIKSKTPVDVWRDLIKQTTHPAGFKLFGEVLIESTGTTEMPVEQKVVETYSCISLPPISLSVISTKKIVNTTILSVNDSKVERGLGSVSIDTFDSSELFAREIGLVSDFNGDYSTETSKAEGDTVFTMYDKKTNLPLSISKAENLIISLDGVIQEPGVAFTVSGTQISFSSSPLGERIVEGQLVEAQKFYGRYIKFKQQSLNNRYFKKLKSISDQFDGNQTTFDLYYTNGSIVKTDPSENLLVFLNGVLQNCKVDEKTPYGNSYYILRSEDPEDNITDKIVFSNPPLNPVDSNDLPEKCYIYSVGSYHRLGIDPNVIQYRKQGPYLIQDEVTNKVTKIDDPYFALVFIDGVLQQEKKSYQIVGPNITFTSPIQKYINESGEEIFQNVSIILLYGRDIPKTLSFYDYEPDTYYNKIILSVTGSTIVTDFYNLTALYSTQPGVTLEHASEFYNQRVKVYQNNILLGELKKVDQYPQDNIVLTLLSTTNILNSITNDDQLIFVVNDNDTFTLSGLYNITSDYGRNEDNERVLVKGKTQPFWLYGTSLGDEIEEYRDKGSLRSLSKGDFIQVDGENSYREVLSISSLVKPKNYNDDQIITNDLYSKVNVTNYNEITRGEGLSINAVLDENGSIIDLIWNERDLTLYFNNNILLQPTAYQYYTSPIIEFVPLDENGGGARAEIITYGGQVLDIVLIDGGVGYTEPPKVVISRGYNKIKSSTRKVDYISKLLLVPKIDCTRVITSTSISFALSGQQPGIQSIISLGSSFGEQQVKREIITIATPEQQESKVSYAKTGIINVLLTDIIQKSSTTISPNLSTNILSTYRLTIQPTISQITKQLSSIVYSGIFDYPASETNHYQLGNAGYNIGIFDKNSLLGNGSSSVSGFTIEEFDLWYPNVTIGEFESRKDSHYFEEGEIFNLAYPSVQEFGTYIDTPILQSTTVVYVTNTSDFSSSGLLLIGREIVRYTSKESDRFLGITRGYLNTEASDYNPGQYVRSIEIADLPLDYALDPGPG